MTTHHDPNARGGSPAGGFPATPDLPSHWRPAVRGSDGLMNMPEALNFEPGSLDQFEAAVTALVEATRAEAITTGYLLDTTFLTFPEDGAMCSFVSINLDPDPDPSEWAATLVFDDPRLVVELDPVAKGWEELAPGNYARSWEEDTDLSTVAADVIQVASTLSDLDGDAWWQFSATALAPAGDGDLEVIAEAAVAVAIRAIVQIHGEIPEDPSQRRNACGALGLDSTAVFGA